MNGAVIILLIYAGIGLIIGGAFIAICRGGSQKDDDDED